MARQASVPETSSPNGPAAEPQITSLDAWQEKAIQPLLLPSGATVKVRFPSVTDLLMENALPEHLLQVAVKEATEAGSTADDVVAGALGGDEIPTQTKETIVQLTELYEIVALRMIVEPVIPDREAYRRLPAIDREYLFTVATRGPESAGSGVDPLVGYETFREEPASAPARKAPKAKRKPVSANQSG